MVDNTQLNAGADGDIIATDDIAGVKHQRVKVQHGADGSATDTSAAAPFPVDTLSVTPGVGANNLGKAVDSVAGATDTGIALLGVHREDLVHLTTADGDYNLLSLDSLGQLHVNPEGHHTFDSFGATTGWTALGSDTLNLATTKKHTMGTDALTFDKVNGAANTVFAGIQKTLSSVDLGDVSPHDLIQGTFYLPVTTDIEYLFLRLGTDSTNYNEWRIPVISLTAATFETGALTIGDADYDGITGNGWNPSAITYISVGAAFNAETNTLAGMIFDEISYHTNQHTSTSINSEVTSSVNSANVNLQKIAGSPADKGAGNASNGCQRIVLATDDVNLASIKTDAGTIASAISGTEMQTDIVAAIPAGTNAIGDVGLTVRTSGGTTSYKNLDVDESEDQVKGSAGQIYWIHCMNLAATKMYLKLYNQVAASVTVGTTVPDHTFPLPTQGDTNGAGFTISIPNGIAFGTGITVAATTGFADADSGAPAANVIILNMGYS